MSEKERKLLDDLRAKSVEAAADVMGGLQRLKSLHEEIAGEDFDSDRTRLGDFLYKLAKLELEHASNILSLGNMQAEMLFEQVRRVARRARGEGGPQKVLELVVDPQQPATGTFEIRNPFDREADARFEVGQMRKQDGTVDPSVVALPSIDGAILAHLNTNVVVDIPTAASLAPGDVRFGELVVFLSANVEVEVARRLIKLKVKTP